MCQLAANPKSSVAAMLFDSGEPVGLRRLPSSFFFYIYQCLALRAVAYVGCAASMKLFLEHFCKLAIRPTKTFSQEMVRFQLHRIH